MEFLDRYLEAVRKHLPWQRQDDIIAELRANLEAQLEEKEAALGRPLTQTEVEDWLKQLGSPMQMAAPYQPQQYLIGPAIFPIYRHVLKLACSWVMLLYAIVTVATIYAARNPSAESLLLALLRLPGVMITLAGWVTLVFAGLEYLVTHGHVPIDKLGPIAEVWSPATLPPLGAQTIGGKQPKSFAMAMTEAIFGVFFLGWLLLVPQHPWVLFGPGAAFMSASPFQLAPVWMQFYWCVVALNVLQVGWDIERLGRGRWQRPQPIRHIVFKSLGILACLFIIAAPDQVTILLRHPALDQARYGTQLSTINHYIHTSFIVITAIALVQLAWDLGRLGVTAYRKRAAAIQ